jgi:hypothetical protein
MSTPRWTSVELWGGPRDGDRVEVPDPPWPNLNEAVAKQVVAAVDVDAFEVTSIDTQVRRYRLCYRNDGRAVYAIQRCQP